MNKTIQSKAPYKAWLFVGILLALGPIFGFAATLFGMTGAYYHMKTQSQEVVDPSTLAETVSWSMYSAVIGIAICPIGIGIIVYAMINMRRIDREANLPA